MANDVSAYIDQLLSLEDAKAEVMNEIKGVYEEAKGAGYDPKALKVVFRRTKMARDERAALDAKVEEYEAALT